MFWDFLPFFVMLLLAAGLALSLLKLSEWLGPYRPFRRKVFPYESGMDPVGTAHERFSIKFYLVSMIFVIFDVEVVFLYPWATSYREMLAAGNGGGSLVVALIFILILGVGLLYDIKKGGLDWDLTEKPIL